MSETVDGVLEEKDEGVRERRRRKMRRRTTTRRRQRERERKERGAPVIEGSIFGPWGRSLYGILGIRGR